MRADQRKFHYIYKITRTDGSGKYYIGMHSTDDLDDGYFGSGHLIARSIRAHGKEKHSKEILEFLPSRKELKARERQLVNEEILDDPLCMNLKLGGEGGWFQTPESENKRLHSLSMAMSRRLLGKPRAWHSPAFAGKAHTEETKQKMRKPKNQGSANSQFGTCWVTNGSPIKIRKELLDEHLAKGFIKGRKLTTVV